MLFGIRVVFISLYFNKQESFKILCDQINQTHVLTVTEPFKCLKAFSRSSLLQVQAWLKWIHLFPKTNGIKPSSQCKVQASTWRKKKEERKNTFILSVFENSSFLQNNIFQYLIYLTTICLQFPLSVKVILENQRQIFVNRSYNKITPSLEWSAESLECSHCTPPHLACTSDYKPVGKAKRWEGR